MKKLLLITLLCFSNFAMAGNSKLGEAKFKMNCKQCHGPAGMGMASYPKVSRSGQEVGPNSALMIMMAKPLSDTDIENLAEYLKNAKRD